MRWTCKDLSPFQQKSKFYVAPHADFDILFGHKTGTSQRRRRKLNINGASGTTEGHNITNCGISTESLDGLRARGGSPAGNVSFEKGIRDGILLLVDGEVRNEKEALLRPSLADLERILHATPCDTSTPSRQAIVHDQESINRVVTRPPQVQGEVLEEWVPQQASNSTEFPLLWPDDTSKRNQSTSGFEHNSRRRSRQCLSMATTALDQDSDLHPKGGFPDRTIPVEPRFTDDRKEFKLLSGTESPWSNSAPHPTSNSREVRPLNTSECLSSPGPIPPRSDHRYPKRNLDESNEYTLDSTPQPLEQRPGGHTFSSEDEDLRPRAENIPRAAIHPMIEGEKLDSSTRYCNPTSEEDFCHIRSSSGKFPQELFPPS